MPRKPQKDRTSLVIAIVLHVVLIGGVVFWAYKTGKLEQIRQAMLQYVKGEKKEEKKQEPVQQKQQAAAPKLPPINQGMPQTQGGGTRRAVASDAPEAAGGSSFFQDTRRQVSGPSTEGAGGAGSMKQTNAPIIKPMVRPPPFKPVFTPAPTSVKQILAERAKSTAVVESFGAEQIARSSVRDVGDIVGRISGSTIVEGKFAVIRGLSDRYTSTLLNGAEVPSGDPYRRSVQLDLFPASMIERVDITKTYTPDQPGGTGGSTINVVTKSFPPEPFLKTTFGVSYNPQANLRNDFLADPRTDMSMFALPKPPDPLDEQLFALTNAPPVPGPASSRETQARAEARRQQADTHQALLQNLGTANFAGVPKSSPLNSGFSASAGDTSYLFGRPLGLFGGINYRRDFKFLDEAQLERSDRFNNVTASGTRQKSNVTTDYGANLNIGYKVTDWAEFGFNFLLAHTTDEEALHDDYTFLSTPAGDTLQKWQLHFTERQINNYQFRGKFDLPPVADSQLEWVVDTANTMQNEPDHRFMNYFLDPLGTARLGDNGLPVPVFPSRYFREVEEDALNVRLDYSIPFYIEGRESKIKAGVFESWADRDFKEQYFGYDRQGGFSAANPNSYLSDPALLNYQAVFLGGIRTNFDFARIINLVVGRPYTASSDIKAAYLMGDFAVLPWLRLVGGARVEKTLIELDAFSAGKPTPLDQTDLLPAAGAVVGLSSNVSLRLNYSQTIARPSFRELSPILNYLPDWDVFARGNPNLQISDITSYDARIEWFPSPGEIFSFGAFYKDLKDPIELYLVQLDGNDITWINRDSAKVWGLEFEGRKSLRFLSRHLEGFTVGVNAAIIKSETELTPTEYKNKTDVDGDGIIDFPTDKTRPLYNQSPYVINLDLSYDHPTSGTSFTVSANLTGERIWLATAQGPDQYEHPPITLDAGIRQKIGRNLTLAIGVRNILDSEYLQTYGPDKSDPLYQSYRRGRTYGISLTAEF